MRPEKICREMNVIHYVLFFFRNNPEFRTRYYHEFIKWVGYDNWDEVLPEIRNSWESARNSFDKLHGLARAFKEFKNPQDILIPRESAPDEALVDSMKEASEVFSELLKLEARIPDNCKPEGIKCLKSLIEIYASGKNDSVKNELCKYFDDRIDVCKELRGLEIEKEKAEIESIKHKASEEKKE
ncbi:MAG: hypothetical protein E7591_03050 [Ruminococcaceae bacterium]|nr:hypothetical protein [Oscillospiraceae bacterium]